MRKRALPALDTPREFDTTTARSINMRAIMSTGNTTTEARVVKALRAAGITGWRRHVKTIGGTPDLVFRSERVVVFIDGCYWHGCPKCGHIPKTNATYWRQKITRNTTRDRRNRATLRRAGYSVIRIWEHELKRRHPEPAWLRRLHRALAH